MDSEIDKKALEIMIREALHEAIQEQIKLGIINVSLIKEELDKIPDDEDDSYENIK